MNQSECVNPHPDGGIERGTHSFDKDGFCNYCGAHNATLRRSQPVPAPGEDEAFEQWWTRFGAKKPMAVKERARSGFSIAWNYLHRSQPVQGLEEIAREAWKDIREVAKNTNLYSVLFEFDNGYQIILRACQAAAQLPK